MKLYCALRFIRYLIQNTQLVQLNSTQYVTSNGRDDLKLYKSQIVCSTWRSKELFSFQSILKYITTHVWLMCIHCASTVHPLSKCKIPAKMLRNFVDKHNDKGVNLSREYILSIASLDSYLIFSPYLLSTCLITEQGNIYHSTAFSINQINRNSKKVNKFLLIKIVLSVQGRHSFK